MTNNKIALNIDKNEWLREDSSDIILKVVLFLLSPFLSFLYSLRRMKTKSSFVVFFLFAVFYGLCYTVVADNDGLIELADAARWRYRFENTYFYSFSDYIAFCKEYFLFAGSDIRDLYFGTVTFFVHLFTDNYHIFFMVVAIVFAIFQLKSFKFLVQSQSFDNRMVCLLICVLFSINGIFNIGGVRYWTAAWMCVYGVFQLYYNGKKAYLALLLLLPLIHRSFFFLYPIIILTEFFNWKKVWSVLYFMSFIFSAFSNYIIQDATPYLPTFLSYMIEAYATNTVSEQYSFTKLFLTSLSTIYVNILFIIIMQKAKKSISAELTPMYQFTLVFISIVNFVMPIPSLGARFMVIAEVFVAFLWLNTMGAHSKYNYLILLMPLFMVRAFYVNALEFVRFEEPSFFFTNPITLLINYL